MTENSGATETIPQEARNWAMACHVIALVGLLGNGFGFFVGPLIVWLIKKNSHPFVDEQGKEAVNFQLTMLIAGIISFILVFVFIGILLLLIVGVVATVFAIIAAIKASNGEHYRYPFALRLIK